VPTCDTQPSPVAAMTGGGMRDAAATVTIAAMIVMRAGLVMT
jgi:hypothetical protein